MFGGSEHTRGRPDIATQLSIDQEIDKYYLKAVSARIVHLETGYDIKTIRKRYKRLAQFRISQNQTGFLQQCKINIDSASSAIGKLILDLHQRKEELETCLKNLPQTHKLYIETSREYRETVKTIAHLISMNIALENTPTADIVLTKLLKEFSNRNVAQSLEN